LLGEPKALTCVALVPVEAHRGRPISARTPEFVGQAPSLIDINFEKKQLVQIDCALDKRSHCVEAIACSIQLNEQGIRGNRRLFGSSIIPEGAKAASRSVGAFAIWRAHGSCHLISSRDPLGDPLVNLTLNPCDGLRGESYRRRE
jgi:hypothetical protein